MAAVDPGLAGLLVVVLVEGQRFVRFQTWGCALVGPGLETRLALVGGSAARSSGREWPGERRWRARAAGGQPGVALLIYAWCRSHGAPNPRIKLESHGCCTFPAGVWACGLPPLDAGRRVVTGQGTGGPEAGGRPPCIHAPVTCLWIPGDAAAAVVPGWVASPAAAQRGCSDRSVGHLKGGMDVAPAKHNA